MSNYEISKSSLLSLKAEILRKQEDLDRGKLNNVEKTKIIKKKTPLDLKNKGVEERRFNDLDEEEQDLLKLSKSKLEAKAKLYDKLSGASNQSEELNRRYLVRFDKKVKVSGRPPTDTVAAFLVASDDEEQHFSDEYDEAVDPSEEWLEYTDCLGRSRKCLRKDLEYLKSKDAELISEKRQPVTSVDLEKEIKYSHELEEANNQETKKSDQDAQSQISTEESELISGDVRREVLRQQWENEEEELRNKADIHYQNVLFNEARQHGVGYYGFSKDEEERAKQQEALKKLREETEQQQKKAQDLKALREKQMAARMKAARNRRRARLGLPPEEDAVPPPESQQESEEENKIEEEREAAAEEAEKLLAEARKRHVRPWDIGKEGVSEHYEMTQQEWNEKKRQERTEEFAPPKIYSMREFSGMQSLECDFEENDKSLKFSTKKHADNKHNWHPTGKNSKSLNPYKSSSYLENEENLRGFKISQNQKASPSKTSKDKPTDNYVDNSEEENGDCLTKDYKKSQDVSLSPSSAALRGNNPYKKYYYDPTEPTSDIEINDSFLRDYKVSKSSAMTLIPIVNELEEIDFDDRLIADYNTVMQDIPSLEEENLSKEADRSRKRGVEIAPPPTFEYYGPGKSKQVKTSSGRVNIADSIEAGLKFLRKQAERKGRHCVDDM